MLLQARSSCTIKFDCQAQSSETAIACDALLQFLEDCCGDSELHVLADSLVMLRMSHSSCSIKLSVLVRGRRPPTSCCHCCASASSHSSCSLRLGSVALVEPVVFVERVASRFSLRRRLSLARFRWRLREVLPLLAPRPVLPSPAGIANVLVSSSGRDAPQCLIRFASRVPKTRPNNSHSTLRVAGIPGQQPGASHLPYAAMGNKSRFKYCQYRGACTPSRKLVGMPGTQWMAVS